MGDNPIPRLLYAQERDLVMWGPGSLASDTAHKLKLDFERCVFPVCFGETDVPSEARIFVVETHVTDDSTKKSYLNSLVSLR
jgi:hypothetical protein